MTRVAMDYKKNRFSKAIKYREIVLKTELLGSCHYFDVHTENIHYTRLRLIKRCEPSTPSVPPCRQIKRAQLHRSPEYDYEMQFQRL